MPVETLRPSDVRLTYTSAMPFRILNKGPDYFRRQADPGARRLSAVERLEADKAKYVKSQQVALTRQAPVKPPIIRKPLLSPGMMFQCRITAPPARKVPRRPADSDNGGREGLGGRRGPALNLEILNNLINNVCEGPVPGSPSPAPSSSSPTASSPSSGAKSVGSSLSAELERERGGGRLLNNLRPSSHGTNTATNTTNTTGSSSTSSCTSSPPLNNSNNNNLQNLLLREEPCRRPPPVPARVPRVVGAAVGAQAVPYGSPNSVTVRRVDVRPQAVVRKPQRAPVKPPVKPRQTAQPQTAHSPQTAQPQVAQPQAPAMAPPPVYLPHSPMLVRAMPPPASPAFTRLSNASSRGSAARKHPSLHRSKSDLSDRYSRATADLERFFNYCGLDPQEVEGLGGVERFARANSDIVSVSKLRSVSTPSSECGGEGGGGGGEDRARVTGEDEDEDGPARGNERVPYGISVIERNARVIKWLYGIRQARDSGNAVSNV